MKIAIYQPRVSYYVGGGETVPLEMAKYFSRHGHLVTIVTTKHPSGNSEYFDNFLEKNTSIKIKYLELPNSLMWIYDQKPGISQLRWDNEAVHAGRIARNYFEKHDFDLLNIHYRVDVLAANIKYPTIMFLHGVPDNLEYFDKVWYSFPNVKYVADSKYIGEKWSDLLGGLKYKVFTNGIDTDYFYPTNVKKDIDILYFGRLVPVKGVNYLIDAVKILADKKYDLKVVIAGGGNQKEQLQKQVRDLSLQNFIKFAGFIPQTDVVNLYNRSNFFVAPSYDREGILTTMLEAAACGLAIVTTNSCSMPEFIEDGVNGLLAKPKDSVSLASKIEKLLENRKYAEKLGLEARKKAELWDWKNKSKSLEEYFENEK